MATIAPSGEEAIRRDEVCVEPAPPIADTASLVDIYDVKETTAWILEHQHRIVGLQFPDELLPHSIPVLQALRRALASEVVGASGKSRAAAEVELYIMADTTYGSCCVDEVAAQHVSADAVVHYGNACLSSCAPRPPSSDGLIAHSHVLSGHLVSLFTTSSPSGRCKLRPQRQSQRRYGLPWTSSRITTSKRLKASRT